MEIKNHHKIDFRPDIEGIRAVAVLLILFNHSSVRGFNGGFVGVDIFFVISGYLITSIFIRDTRNGQHSTANFYRRRILRIFPALFAMLACTTALCFVFMVPSELATYAKSLLATVLFASNFAFYADTGYFTLAAATRPLLHTWSLAIEEQFYIFWPLLLMVFHRRGANSFNALLVGTVVLSLTLSIWMVATDMSAAFYLLPFRAWELALGGMLTMLPPPRDLPRWLRQLAGAAGIVAILACSYFYRELTIPFPGLAATIPCLGAAALVASGPDTLVGRLLSIPIARFFGRISYSLYLWHWPVIVFTRLALWPMHEGVVVAADIAISIALAWLSYRFIEQAGRKWLDRFSNQRIFAIAFGLILAGVVTGGVIIAQRGFPGRYPADALKIAAVFDGDEQKTYRSGSCFVVEPGDRFDPAACLKQDATRPSLLLIGDSVAAHYWPGFARQTDSVNTLQATMAGCRPQISTRIKFACQAFFNDMLIGWTNKNRPDAVALAGNWQESDLPAVEATLSSLKDRGIKAIVIGPMPRYDTSLARLLLFLPQENRQAGAARHIDPGVWAVDAHMRETALSHGASYISPVQLLCKAQRCQVFAGSNIPLQFDDVHLTHQGSELLIERMMPQIRAALGQPSKTTSAAPEREY